MKSSLQTKKRRGAYISPRLKVYFTCFAVTERATINSSFGSKPLDTSIYSTPLCDHVRESFVNAPIVKPRSTNSPLTLIADEASATFAFSCIKVKDFLFPVYVSIARLPLSVCNSFRLSTSHLVAYHLDTK